MVLAQSLGFHETYTDCQKATVVHSRCQSLLSWTDSTLVLCPLVHRAETSAPVVAGGPSACVFICFLCVYTCVRQSKSLSVSKALSERFLGHVLWASMYLHNYSLFGLGATLDCVQGFLLALCSDRMPRIEPGWCTPPAVLPSGPALGVFTGDHWSGAPRMETDPPALQEGPLLM